MSKLDEKLKEIHSRRKHEQFISKLQGSTKDLFVSCEQTNRSEALKNIAMSTWENGVLTTSRGKLNNWKRTEYETLEEAKKSLIAIPFTKAKVGWLSFNFKPPHYRVEGKELQQHLNEILITLKNSNKYGVKDLSWVGEEEDFGLILEYNHRPKGNEFEVCRWEI